MDLSISLSNYPSSNQYTRSCVTTTNDIVSPLSNSNHDPTGQSIQYLELLPHGPCYNNQTTQYASNDLSNNGYAPSQLMPNTTADSLKLGNFMTGKNHELIYSKSAVESRRSSNPNTPTNVCKNWGMNISSSYTIDVNEVPITKNVSNISSGQTCNHNYNNYNSNSSVEMIGACDGNSNNTIKCKYNNDSANSHAGSVKKRRLSGHEDQINHEDYGNGEEEIYDDQEGISDHDEQEQEEEEEEEEENSKLKKWKMKNLKEKKKETKGGEGRDAAIFVVGHCVAFW